VLKLLKTGKTANTVKIVKTVIGLTVETVKSVKTVLTESYLLKRFNIWYTFNVSPNRKPHLRRRTAMP